MILVIYLDSLWRLPWGTSTMNFIQTNVYKSCKTCSHWFLLQRLVTVDGTDNDQKTFSHMTFTPQTEDGKLSDVNISGKMCL